MINTSEFEKSNMSFGASNEIIQNLNKIITNLRAENENLIEERDILKAQLKNADKIRKDSLIKVAVELGEKTRLLESTEARLRAVEKLPNHWQFKAEDTSELGSLHSYDRLYRVAIRECIKDLEAALSFTENRGKGLAGHQ